LFLNKSSIGENMAQAYCVKCKDKREMVNAKEVTMKGKGDTKRSAVTGSCEKCGTKMFKILPKSK
jgi:RNase P subunit RPR2